MAYTYRSLLSRWQMYSPGRPCTPLLPRDNPLMLLNHLEWTRLLIFCCGILPAELLRREPHKVLALACGPGDWPLDLAQSDRSLKVIGVARDRAMIDFARTRAAILSSQATFVLADITTPPAFKRQSFDLVRIHLLGEEREHYTDPALLEEYRRILCLGGTLWISESPTCEANAPSYQALITLLGNITPRTGQDGNSVDALPSRLSQAGFTAIEKRRALFDFSFGTPLHEQLAHRLLSYFDLLEPPHTLPEAVEYRLLRRQLEEELNDRSFAGCWTIEDVWGQKQDRD
jgi:ubiquinone/menaquinone biosynthesis C-methylase UbiE